MYIYIYVYICVYIYILYNVSKNLCSAVPWELRWAVFPNFSGTFTHTTARWMVSQRTTMRCCACLVPEIYLHLHRNHSRLSKSSDRASNLRPCADEQQQPLRGSFSHRVHYGFHIWLETIGKATADVEAGTFCPFGRCCSRQNAYLLTAVLIQDILYIYIYI